MVIRNCHYGNFHCISRSRYKNNLLNSVLTGEELGHSAVCHMNYLDKTKSSPLHLAVRGGNIETIRLCIATGAKVDQQQVLLL